ncbi:hypothetical protein [Dyella silvatica]|uniref:hypothetical protein n=1 Tax=Dyella silvatica TaxID=2992128 RepID=UPI00225075E1|nr:hypothetical protein [Dyella silvatica]
MPEWFAAQKMKMNRAAIFRVADPPNRFTEEIEGLTDDREKRISQALPRAEVIRSELLAEVGSWNDAINHALPNCQSVILDVTALPKRVFLFLLARLLAKETLKDLIVCYARAGTYPEGPLCQDFNPIEAIPSYSRISSKKAETLVVGVGYVGFDIDELIKQVQPPHLNFLFPFPPGSPAARRNWGLLRKLIPSGLASPIIQRIHAMDMFAAYDWLCSLGGDVDNCVDMIALGPKPHSIAMGMAYRKLGDNAQILYAQPRTYRPDYSVGIGRNVNGEVEIFAYCLRRNGVNYL